MADFMQGALGQPVRLGRPPQLPGMPEAHHAPGFATLAGLCLYAAEDPVDIRAVGSGRGGIYRGAVRSGGLMETAMRLVRALRENF
jgi:cell division protein FtsA